MRRRVYNPDRLKYPMKRVGKRGEGKFERISWEEAFDTIASNMQRLIKEYGNESIYLNYIERLVDGFCVAITEEGAALRVAGITKPVLVLTPLTSRDDALAAEFYRKARLLPPCSPTACCITLFPYCWR